MKQSGGSSSYTEITHFPIPNLCPEDYSLQPHCQTKRQQKQASGFTQRQSFYVDPLKAVSLRNVKVRSTLHTRSSHGDCCRPTLHANDELQQEVSLLW